jgi:hypothetical protein
VLANNNSIWLAGTNSMLRQVNLFCNLAAPALAGVIMSFASDRVAALFIACWSILALSIELFSVKKLFSMSPALAIRSATKPKSARGSKLQSTRSMDTIDDPDGIRRREGRFTPWASIAIYTRQRVLPAGIALAILCLTVLNFGAVQIAYMSWRGMSAAYIGGLRAAAAFAGLVGSWFYPMMVRRSGLFRTGLTGLTWQWLVLLVVIVSLWVRNALANVVIFQ